MINMEDSLDRSIKEKVFEILKKDRKGVLDEKECEPVYTDSIGEVIEKLIIVHIRAWYLEDSARDSNLSDAERGRVKQKIDINNGVKRPRLVAALNKMLDDACKGKVELDEGNTKFYKNQSN